MLSSKQPKGLYLLFFTELWERFGFYTVQTILVLYMSKGLHFTEIKADLIYGTFSSMLYLTPVLGGYLADRFIGFQRSILVGGVLFILGYALCALPSQQWFFLGLSTIIIANGFLKPNVSSIVGSLYEKNDPRRESGFTIFYMGINIGALLPPLFIGYVVRNWGWHYGFIFAVIGMLIGVVNFYYGRYRLAKKGLYPTKPINGVIAKYIWLWILIGIVAALCLLSVIFHYPLITDTVLISLTVVVILTVLYFLLQEPKESRDKMIAALILIIVSIGFWAIYNQTFSSLMFFADRNMSTQFLGFTINAEFTQFFNSFFIITLSPILSQLWLKLGKKHNPSIPVKFALGILLMAVGILFLAYGASLPHADSLMSPWWLAISYGIQTIGELLISPVGLAMITVLSPDHLVGMMMGVWFFAQSTAFVIGGFLAAYAAIPAGTSAITALSIYKHAFEVYGLVALVSAAISFLLIPTLKRLMHAPAYR